MTPVLSPELFGKFQEIVYERSDLHFAPSKRVFFERQLREKLRKDGFGDFESYYASLKMDPSRLDGLVQDLTTNQTFFFRNQAQFAALMEKVLPEIIEAKNRDAVKSWSSPSTSRRRPMSLRIWSAGCSTGEEAYSIAFTLLEVLKY